MGRYRGRREERKSDEAGGDAKERILLVSLDPLRVLPWEEGSTLMKVFESTKEIIIALYVATV